MSSSASGNPRVKISGNQTPFGNFPNDFIQDNDSNRQLDSDYVSELFNDQTVLLENWHSEFFFEFPEEIHESNKDHGWRLKERTKTAAIILTICLNIGTDPPDIVKPQPCARRECWLEPTLPKQKGIEIIGNALQLQYEKLSTTSKIKFKQSLDPTVEELRKSCVQMRKTVKNERILFHYNGHGVPRPTRNGEIWLFGRNYSHYLPVSINEVRSWIGEPAIYLFDCSSAGVLIPQLVDMYGAIFPNDNLSSTRMDLRATNNTSSDMINSLKSFSLQQLTYVMSGPQHFEGPCIVLAACKADEILPTNPMYPADMFTSCLTTPIAISLRWLILQNSYSLGDVSLEISEFLPGKEGDRRTPRGELYWVFTAITDTIAWSSLPLTTFQKIYRQEMLVATLFRNFLLARRIMKSFSCTCQSWPILPDTSNHPLWQTWDLAAESCLLHVSSMLRGTMMLHPKNNMPLAGGIPPIHPQVSIPTGTDIMALPIPPPNLPFFTEQLTAFEIWLDYGNKSAQEVPVYLPVILQVLMSPTHRLRALILLKRYLSTGSQAVSSTLLVGIFPYILRLLQSSATDIRQVLIAIWAHVIGFDESCRQDLIRDKYHSYFIQFISMKEYSLYHRTLSMFILTIMCSNFREGQTVCLQQGLHRSCTALLSQQDNFSCIPFMQWTCLCLSKLLEDFIWAKYLCITEAGHTQLYPLLTYDDPILRATAVLTLGEVFGASTLTKFSNGGMSSMHHAHLGMGLGLGTVGPIPSSSTTSTASHARSNSDMSISSVESLVDPRELRETEMQLALQILDCCTDGCSAVRYESIVALSKFVILPAHIPCFAIITRSLIKLKVIDPPTKTKVSFSFGPGIGTGSKPSSPPLPTPGKSGGSSNPYGSNSKGPSPDPIVGASNSNNQNDNSNGGNVESVFPWNLSSSQTQSLVDEVRAYLETQGIGLTPPTSPHPISSELDKPMNNAEDKSGSRRISREVDPENVQVSGMMAAAYVRFWLAIYEVQGKDPHIYVARAARELSQRVLDQISFENARNSWASSQKNLHSMANQLNQESAQVKSSVSFNSWSYDSESIPPPPPPPLPPQLSFQNGSMQPIQYAPLSPLGLSMHSSPRRQGNNQFNFAKPRPNDFPSIIDQASVSSSSEFSAPYGFPGQISWGPTNGMQQVNMSSSLLYPPTLSAGLGEDSVLADRTQYAGNESSPIWPALSSSLYNWSKRLFLLPNDGLENIYDDALTLEGSNRLYRQEKYNLIRQTVNKLVETYKVLDDSQDYQILDRKTKEEQQSQRSSAIAALPQSLVKFEQKTILNIDNAKMTSLLLFHPLHDILATSDGHNVKIWSIANGSKVMEISNTHNHLGSLVGMNSSSSTNGSSSKSRITSMNWINESYETLLMIGSDNGNIDVWRDVTDSFDSSQVYNRASNSSVLDMTGGQRDLGNFSATLGNKLGVIYDVHSSQYTSSPNTNLTLATSFTALPDIADTNRGSGLVTAWIPEKGMVVVGGNSATIRVWDLASERCSRIFTTGLDTCTTALASKAISSSFFNSPSSFLDSNTRTSFPRLNGFDVDDVSQRLSWTFAGFADGTVSVFDERTTSNTKVHSARADTGAWIVAAYTRHDLPQVITASVKGTVRFWDIRNMRVYKTLEVFKHPLTALAVHRCIPLMATGSHSQVVKIFTMGGDQLDRDIKYHDGFLGQRIGPVSCLAFHPYKMMLASGATDNLVSIYSPSDT